MDQGCADGPVGSGGRGTDLLGRKLPASLHQSPIHHGVVPEEFHEQIHVRHRSRPAGSDVRTVQPLDHEVLSTGTGARERTHFVARSGKRLALGVPFWATTDLAMRRASIPTSRRFPLIGFENPMK
jgi:hypothetical protein